MESGEARASTNRLPLGSLPPCRASSSSSTSAPPTTRRGGTSTSSLKRGRPATPGDWRRSRHQVARRWRPWRSRPIVSPGSIMWRAKSPGGRGFARRIDGGTYEPALEGSADGSLRERIDVRLVGDTSTPKKVPATKSGDDGQRAPRALPRFGGWHEWHEVKALVFGLKGLASTRRVVWS